MKIIFGKYLELDPESELVAWACDADAAHWNQASVTARAKIIIDDERDSNAGSYVEKVHGTDRYWVVTGDE